MTRFDVVAIKPIDALAVVSSCCQRKPHAQVAQGNAR